eukprot:103870_1
MGNQNNNDNQTIDQVTEETAEIHIVTGNKVINEAEAIQEHLLHDFGFDPKAYCWQYVDKEGNLNPELFNVPMLQVHHHIFGDIKPTTPVQMTKPDPKWSVQCPEPTELNKLDKVWHEVQYPRCTWHIINDDCNIVDKFHEFDVDGDGYVNAEEVKGYWQQRGLNNEEIEAKIAEMLSADKERDNKVNYLEFKRRFFVVPDHFFNDDFRIRASRYAFAICIPLLCLLVLAFNPDIKVSVVLGISVQVMYLVYFATLGYYFWHSYQEDDRYLYRVFSRPGVAQIKNAKWAPLRMPLNQIAWPLKAIHSVSEFSAVAGAMPSIMLSNIGQYTWVMITLHFMIKSGEKGWSWGFSDVFVIIGVAGLVMFGVFEADPFNYSVNTFHMVGALTGFGTVIGFMMESHGALHSVISVILIVLFVVFYWSWNVTLAMSYQEEANSWGLYDGEEEKEEQIRKEKEKQNFGTLCCLFTGMPLLWFLVSGIKPIWWAKKHRKKIKESDGSASHKKYMAEFQPALQYWEEDITTDIKNRITTMSLANVLFEGVVLMVGATAISMWLMEYGRDCGGFCVDQVLMLILVSSVLVTATFASYKLLGFTHSKHLHSH